VTDVQEARDKRWIALILLCSAQFVVVLDASIVNVALPTIGEALNFSEGNLPWVVNAYVLTFGGFLLLGGRLVDLLGRRRIFMGGLVLFALASLAGGLAANSGQLIAARAVQGLGAAILSPAALSIVATTFKDGAERNKALGIWGAVAGSGGAAGVLLGGVLTESLGWEWVLWVNVPIGILAAAISPALIAETRDEKEVRHFDVAGAVTITLGLSALVFALLDAESAGWGSAQTIGTLAASALLLAAFVAIERRSRAPLVPFSIFRIRTITGANVVGLLIGASLFSMFFFISLYMQQVLGYSPIHAGLSYLPLAVSIILSAAFASSLVTKVGFKPILATGMVLIANRPDLVLPDLRPRQLPRRHPRPLAVRRRRPRLRLRAGDDRRRLRHRRPRAGARQRPHQHLPAGRRRARPGDPRRRRQRDHQRLPRPGQADRRLPGGLPRGRRLRDRRPDRHPAPNPHQRQPRPRRTRQRTRGGVSNPRESRAVRANSDTCFESAKPRS
jgi:EmrB/QacA subfamily drug resistance transporter